MHRLRCVRSSGTAPIILSSGSSRRANSSLETPIANDELFERPEEKRAGASGRQAGDAGRVRGQKLRLLLFDLEEFVGGDRVLQ